MLIRVSCLVLPNKARTKASRAYRGSESRLIAVYAVVQSDLSLLERTCVVVWFRHRRGPKTFRCCRTSPRSPWWAFSTCQLESAAFMLLGEFSNTSRMPRTTWPSFIGRLSQMPRRYGDCDTCMLVTLAPYRMPLIFWLTDYDCSKQNLCTTAVHFSSFCATVRRGQMSQDKFILSVGAQVGGCLVDGLGDGVMVQAPGLDVGMLRSVCFGLLQVE